LRGISLGKQPLYHQGEIFSTPGIGPSREVNVVEISGGVGVVEGDGLGVGTTVMRFFAGLLAYLVGVLAIVSIGIIGLMALRLPVERTPSTPITAAASHVEPAKPVKQTLVARKNVRPRQKNKTVHITSKRTREAPTIGAGHEAYGYASEAPRRRIDPNLFSIFGH